MKRDKPAGISEKVIRLLDIYTMIAQKQFPSVPFLTAHFHVSERSVYRYLEIINMIDGIEYDQERKGYRFTSGDRLKKLSLSDNELLVLFAAGEAVSYLGQALGTTFQGLMGRVAAGKSPGAKEKIPIVVKMPEAAGSEKLSDYFTSVSACLNEQRAVEMVYRAHHSRKVTTRVVDPYGMVFYEGVWTVIGYCHLRKDIRTFTFDRIMELKERNLYFKPPEDFSFKEYLSRSWGIVEGEEVRIRLRFKANVADYLLRKKWHPSEERKVLPDGGVEIIYRVAGAGEIKHWIYSWLPDVEILEPAWLREQAAEELLIAGKRHKGDI